MAGDSYPTFRNDHSIVEIRIGIKMFNCISVSPPHDYPHIYFDMCDEDTIICAHRATLFRFAPRMRPGEADPPNCLYSDHADA